MDVDTKSISSYLGSKKVLVTGAGGSIGSEVVRQLTRFGPDVIILVDHDENRLNTISRELRERRKFHQFQSKIGDIRDFNTMQGLFDSYNPEVVFHAAAYKHVSLMEENPAQSVFNNVLGTKNLVNLSLHYRVGRFVNISTDKAVNPSSIMGVSKRVAEHIVSWGSARAMSNQFYVSVRFGNVLGSNGSIIPIFKEQIQSGGPVTVTHPEMTRYFMTMTEAAQLVLQAGAIEENGSLFVLDMGEPIKIVDVARDLICLMGFVPERDIKIIFTGAKPGEKMFEETHSSEEELERTQYERILSVKKSLLPQNLEVMINALHAAAKKGDAAKIRQLYKHIEPSYTGDVEGRAFVKPGSPLP